MSVTLTCPNCSANLRLKEGADLTKPRRCPKCSEAFTPGESVGAAASEYGEPYGGDMPSAAPPVTTPGRQRAPARKGAASKKQENSNTPMILGIAGAALITLIGLGALAIMFFVGGGADDAPGAGGGIAGGDPAQAQKIDEQARAVPKSKSIGAAVTDEEGRAFVEKIETAVQQQDVAGLQKLMNFPAIIDKVTAGIEAPPGFETGFRNGIQTSSREIANQIIVTVGETGSYRFVHFLEDDGLKIAIIRMYNPDNGLNYHRFDLVRDKTGQVVSGDVYFELSGEYLSTSLRRLYLPAVAEQSKGLLGRLTGQEHALVKHIDDIQAMNRATQRQQFGQVLTVYRRLPEPLQREKFILINRMNAAAQVSDTEYLACMEDFRKYHPNDACLDFILIDYYTIKEDYAKVRESIDRVDKSVGGDPFLNTLRGVMLSLDGEHQQARDLLTPLLDDEVIGEYANTTLLDVVIAQQDHAATRKVLDTLENDYGYQFGEISAEPIFADFVASDEYQQWQASR